MVLSQDVAGFLKAKYLSIKPHETTLTPKNSGHTQKTKADKHVRFLSLEPLLLRTQPA